MGDIGFGYSRRCRGWFMLAGMTENIRNQIRQILVSRGATDGLEEVWAKARPVFQNYAVNTNDGAAYLRELFEEEQNQI